MNEQPPVNSDYPEQQQWLDQRLHTESPELAMLVGLIASQHPADAAAAGHRARLDAYMALQSSRQADALNKLTRALVVLTGALVAVAIAQVIVAAITG